MSKIKNKKNAAPQKVLEPIGTRIAKAYSKKRKFQKESLDIFLMTLTLLKPLMLVKPKDLQR